VPPGGASTQRCRRSRRWTKEGSPLAYATKLAQRARQKRRITMPEYVAGLCRMQDGELSQQCAERLLKIAGRHPAQVENR
jgi:hypothetical protein